jgi:hypothetical protein
MSIPLDQLYNYLESISRDDIIIYCFRPHGSKKLADLSVKNTITLDWFKRMTTISLIFHDQEPLNYHLYDADSIWSNYQKNNLVNVSTFEKQLPELKKLVLSMNLRSCIVTPHSCYDKVLLCHSEKNSKELKLYEDNGFIGVYWWSHAAIARDWFRYAEHDPKLNYNVDYITRDFLIYNRAWTGTREYRLTFMEMLTNNNLASSCHTRFSPTDSGINYVDYVFNNKDLTISRFDLENIYELNLSNSSASADYNSEDYITAGIEVVLETLFDDQRNHLTEKSLRPIACGKPFILTATPNSLRYLRQYGFETFDGLIDESYDVIVDPKQRLQAIIKEMRRISLLDSTAKKILWTELYKISKRNQTKFFSPLWYQHIISEYVTNFNHACIEIDKHTSGLHWKKLQEIGKNNPNYVRLTTTDSPQCTVQQREQAIKWLQDRNQ